MDAPGGAEEAVPDLLGKRPLRPVHRLPADSPGVADPLVAEADAVPREGEDPEDDARCPDGQDQAPEGVELEVEGDELHHHERGIPKTNAKTYVKKIASGRSAVRSIGARA